MLLQIFYKKQTLYIFLVGFIIHYFLFLIKGYPLGNVFIVGAVGGVAFCGIWMAILKGLIFLLGQEEIAYFFDIKLPQTNSYEQDDDENDDLTVDDLYNFSDNKNESFFEDSQDRDGDSYNSSYADPTYNSDSVGMGASNNMEDVLSSSSNSDIKLDPSGNFDFTINGKTLNVSPKEGAQAIKKVLHDDNNS